MKQFFLLCMATMLLVACTKHNEKVEALHKEVMEGHDVAMEKMGDIYDQVSKLRDLEEKVTEGGGDEAGEWLPRITIAINQLQVADDAMMDWMAEYKKPDADKPLEESLSYLESEKKKIADVDLIMDASLAESKHLLEKAATELK